MAIACLFVEAMQSFISGWQQPTEKRKKPYRKFFANFPDFGVSSSQADELYDNIRSGILHQGETKGGWRVLRSGPLLDPANRKVNASLFFKEVVKSFERYCQELQVASWDSKKWRSFRNRMEGSIKNCES